MYYVYLLCTLTDEKRDAKNLMISANERRVMYDSSSAIVVKT